MEQNKRGWIKNVIIVFLAVMLVLTLFSNTIMNKSLPEVSVQSSESGTISSQIKLSGSVSANQTKQVNFDVARNIDSVMVRRGDTVERGTVLATLIAGTSSDVYDLEIELKRLQIEYKQMLVESEDSLGNLKYQLEDANAELADIEKYISEYPELGKQLTAYEERIAVLELQISEVDSAIKSYEKEIKSYDKLIADVESQMAEVPNPGYSTTAKLNQAISDAKKVLSDAETAMSAAKRLYNTAKKSYDSAKDRHSDTEDLLDVLTADISSLEDGIAAAKTEKTALSGEIAVLLAKEAEGTITPEEALTLASKQETLAALNASISADESSLSAKKTERIEKEQELARAGENLSSTYNTYTSALASYNGSKSSVEAAEDRVSELTQGKTYLVLKGQKSGFEEVKKGITDKMNDIAEQRTEFEEEISAINKDVAKLSEKMPMTQEQAEKKKTEISRTIKGYETSIRIAEANGSVKKETDALNLEIKKSEIEKKKAEIASRKKMTVTTEITAPVSGTVSGIYISSGDKVEAGTTAFEITMSENGYTMECSVTNAQAAKLRVGQQAEVQYYYWGAKPSVYISTIKNDPSNPGKGKIVVFNVSGDISDGTSLSLLVGSAGQSYDCIVPNSAIREDADGKFILMCVSKSSPLGNRYFAERKNVSVLASDATRSAVDISLSWGDYIITNASVPISDGMQVRMSE